MTKIKVKIKYHYKKTNEKKKYHLKSNIYKYIYKVKKKKIYLSKYG